MRVLERTNPQRENGQKQIITFAAMISLSGRAALWFKSSSPHTEVMGRSRHRSSRMSIPIKRCPAHSLEAALLHASVTVKLQMRALSVTVYIQSTAKEIITHDLLFSSTNAEGLRG